MPGEAARIDELRLRVPGLSTEEGRQFGQQVSQRIAEGLRLRGRNERLSELDLRIAVPPGTSRDRLAETVAQRILGALR